MTDWVTPEGRTDPDIELVKQTADAIARLECACVPCDCRVALEQAIDPGV